LINLEGTARSLGGAAHCWDAGRQQMTGSSDVFTQMQPARNHYWLSSNGQLFAVSKHQGLLALVTSAVAYMNPADVLQTDRYNQIDIRQPTNLRAVGGTVSALQNIRSFEVEEFVPEVER
jgi:hypothetical protein